MDLTAISKYRGELMGIGMLNVLLLHFFTLNNMPVPILASAIINLVFVQGFLFLSGFGLYYSFTKNGNIKSFYKRRFMSVMIPYIVIALPYYTYFSLTDQQNLIPIYSESYFKPDNPILVYLGRITTLGYWFEGNYNGMWYISLSLILFVFFPIIYKSFKGLLGRGKIQLLWLLLIAIVSRLYLFANYVSPLYSQTIGNALSYVYMFLIGIMFGKWSYNKEGLDFNKLVIIGVLCWVAPKIKTIMAMLILCFIFETVRKCGIEVIKRILRWLGNHSLEIYVLHLSLFALLIVFGKNNSMVVPYFVNLAIAYLSTIPLAIVVKELADRIKSVIQ